MASETPCQNIANHTGIPDGYSSWDAHTIKSHIQTQCPVCGLWAIWVTKDEYDPEKHDQITRLIRQNETRTT